MLKVVWAPVAICAVLIAGLLYEWPPELLAPAVSAPLLLGILTTVSYFKQKRSERSAVRLEEMAAYFARRFAGNSSLSIFAVVEGLVGLDRPRVGEWLRGCSMSRTIFDAWCEAFAGRIESDAKAVKLTRVYLRELWSLIIHYQEFIEQFYEVATTIEVPRETADQYNRFVAEYNPFLQRVQDYIGKLRVLRRTEIEPPSVKLAKALPVKQISQPAPKQETVFGEPADHKGYILGRRPSSSER